MFQPCTYGQWTSSLFHSVSMTMPCLKEEYGYKELEDTLIKTYVSVGVKLNHKKAVSLITMLRNKRMIVQENGRKYTFMPDFHY